jgi:transcriptional antiterminator NusG
MARRKPRRFAVDTNRRGHKVARTWVNRQRWRIHERPLTQSLPNLNPGEGWYVARVMAGQEGNVAWALRKAGLTIFVPRFAKIAERDGKKREAFPVLVPGYVFVGFDGEAKGDAAIRGLEPVIDLLSCQDAQSGALTPIRVPEAVMARFVREVSSEAAKPLPIEFVLRPGDGIKITEGPFAGFLATVERVERGMVEALVEIMGGATNMRIPIHSVEAVG